MLNFIKSGRFLRSLVTFPSRGGWPSGSDGPLNLGATDTLIIPAGVIKNYSSITIAAGGQLQISQGTSGWTYIGCSGNAVINGTITSRNAIDTTTPVFGYDPSGKGTVLNQARVRLAGGVGGACARGGSGGSQNNGFGGGGGAQGVTGGSATATQGGSGGVCSGSSAAAGGLFNQVGGAGASYINGCIGDYGNGGGGGGPGYHGGLIYIHVLGDVSGSGTINVNGQVGAAGGAGGSARYGQSGCGTYSCSCDNCCAAAGGGGGGAGGNGGNVIIRYNTRNATYPTITVAGGTGGAAGAPGTDDACWGGSGSANAGGAGTTGSVGSSTWIQGV